MDESGGAILKELRKKKKVTAKETVEKLSSLEYEISEKTISGYETGIRMPNADVFMALCTIYDCKNILEMFSFIKADYSIPTDSEWDMVEKYRFISTHSPEGAVMVDTVLNRENSIAEKIKEQKEHIEELEKNSSQNNSSYPGTRLINYYFRLASAGTGQIVFDMPPTEKIEIPDIPEYRKVDYAIGVNGNSMQPEYNDGDILLIEMTEEIEPGEIGIFIVNGESFVKKLGDRELISLNPDYGNISLTEDSKCRGRVVGKL